MSTFMQTPGFMVYQPWRVTEHRDSRGSHLEPESSEFSWSSAKTMSVCRPLHSLFVPAVPAWNATAQSSRAPKARCTIDFIFSPCRICADDRGEVELRQPPAGLAHLGFFADAGSAVKPRATHGAQCPARSRLAQKQPQPARRHARACRRSALPARSR